MKLTRLHVVLVTGIMAGAIVPHAPAAGGNADRDEMMPSGGRKRTYHVHVPGAVQAGGPRPLVLVLHGAGGTGEGGAILGRAVNGRVLSVDETVGLWARLNGCPAALRRFNLAPIDPADPTRVRRTTSGPCRLESEVALYTIEGGGHTWPGTAPLAILGPTSRQINATQVIWEFFERHPRR